MIDTILKAQADARTKDVLNIWTIYDHPKDHPNDYVARCFEFNKPTGIILTSPHLSILRRNLDRCGLVCLKRNEGDDPVIVETWL